MSENSLFDIEKKRGLNNISTIVLTFQQKYIIMEYVDGDNLQTVIHTHWKQRNHFLKILSERFCFKFVLVLNLQDFIRICWWLFQVISKSLILVYPRLFLQIFMQQLHLMLHLLLCHQRCYLDKNIHVLCGFMLYFTSINDIQITPEEVPSNSIAKNIKPGNYLKGNGVVVDKKKAIK